MNLRLLLLLLLPISLFSCKKGGDDAHDAEMRKLNAWILVNNITVTPTASGMYFIPVKEGTGEMPSDTSYIYYNYSLETLDGDIIESTEISVADNWGFHKPTTHYTPGMFRMNSKMFTVIKGIHEAAMLMKEGGRARLILPSNLAFGSQGFGSVLGGNTSIIVNLELYKVVNNIASYEKELVYQYSEDSLPQPKESMEKGNIYYKKLIQYPDSLLVADVAKEVRVYYIGRFLDGYIFDTNIKAVAEEAGIYNANKSYTPFSVTLESNAVVPAFEKVLLMMRKDEKFKLVTTSSFGYGEQLNNPGIPPFSPLVFEITVDTLIKK